MGLKKELKELYNTGKKATTPRLVTCPPANYLIADGHAGLAAAHRPSLVRTALPKLSKPTQTKYTWSVHKHTTARKNHGRHETRSRITRHKKELNVSPNVVLGGDRRRRGFHDV